MLPSKAVLASRIATMRAVMDQHDFEALVLFSHPSLYVGPGSQTLGNVRYLTGYSSAWHPSLLVLPRREEPVLIVPDPFELKRMGTDWLPGDVQIESSASYGRAARDVIKARCSPAGKIGLVGGSEMPFAMHVELTADPNGLEFAGADELTWPQRAVKEPGEVQLHREAARTADAMHEGLVESVSQGARWAWQHRIAMEMAGRSRLAEIVRAWLGPGRAPDHANFLIWEDDHQMKDGDQLFAGTYVVFHGYLGHSIRAGFKGKPTSGFKKVFEILMEAQEAGIEQIRPGAPIREVPKAITAILEGYVPGGSLGTPGHGLGLDYYEPLITHAYQREWASRSGEVAHPVREEPVLEPGMVLELHPSLAAPDLGSPFAMVGDMFLVTKTGSELLTQFPREIFAA